MIPCWVVEGVLDDVVDQKHNGTVAVVAFDDGLETFLAGSVPDLQFDVELLVDFDDFGGKLDP